MRDLRPQQVTPQALHSPYPELTTEPLQTMYWGHLEELFIELLALWLLSVVSVFSSRVRVFNVKFLSLKLLYKNKRTSN